MRKDALRNSRLSVSLRVRREKTRSEFKIIAVVRTDQLNCSRVSANEQSNVFGFFLNPITASASTTISPSLHS